MAYKAKDWETGELITEAALDNMEDGIVALNYGPNYDGQDLTVVFADEIAGYSDPWAWIKARKTSGNFAGLHVCDYIPVVVEEITYNAKILGINTYEESGNQLVGNHIDFIFDKLWNVTQRVNRVNYNNGLIPIENITADGTTTAFALIKHMDGVASVKNGNADVTGWTYNSETWTLTFAEAPAAATLTVTGTGDEDPWLSSELYKFCNSRKGQVPNGTGNNPPILQVDYTEGGILYKLPTALKDKIIEKLAYVPKRYDVSSVAIEDTNGEWANIGKIWIPSEIEVFGTGIFNNSSFSKSMGVQYPFFAENAKNRNLTLPSGTRTTWWLLVPCGGDASRWCEVTRYRVANADNAATSFGIPVCFRI